MAHLDIANRLAIYGYKHELEDFDNTLAYAWWTYGYADQFGTVEMLLHHPDVALEFCSSVRRDTEVPDLLANEILLRLTNIRKSGFLDASKPERN